MKFTAFILCVMLATSAFANTTHGYPEEEDVIVLKHHNFEEAIKKFEYLLVEFYAPWCGHCKKLAPEYAAAAKILKSVDPAIPLAKVDASEHQELANKYQVQGYPTLKFFVKGEPVDFNGGRTTAEIVNWIKKKTGPSTTQITDAAALEKLKTDNKVVVAYFGAEDDHFKNFMKVAQANDALTFVHSHDAALREAAGADIVLYKQFDEGHNTYTGDYSVESVKEFINAHRFPTVMPFEGDEAIERIFGKEASAVVLFTDDSNSEEYRHFQEAAKQAKGKLVFAHSTVTTGLGQRLADYVGVKVADAPAAWIIAPKSGDLSKFPLKEKITRENVLKFVDHFENDKLERHFKSQEVPEKNDESVKTVVGKNFNDVVLTPGKHVLVEFYAPWCGHCKTLAPIYEETAKALEGNDKILLVKVDATENEIPGVQVQGFPTLKFYHADRKDTPVEFQGERTKEGIFKFLKEHAAEDWTDL
jgi:protein disulfide-isomerase A1